MTTYAAFDTAICIAIRIKLVDLLVPPGGDRDKLELDECDDETSPLEYSVWLDGDIIGAGMDADLAMADALKTVTAWVAEGTRALS
jgi:hypothetical protein